MASAAAAATALKASTTKGMDIAAPKPPIVTAKAAPAQPRATLAPPSEQPVTATRPRARPKARAITNTVAPPAPHAPIAIPEAPAVTTIAVSRGARRKRDPNSKGRDTRQTPTPSPIHARIPQTEG
jgi:hypothetical protein